MVSSGSLTVAPERFDFCRISDGWALLQLRGAAPAGGEGPGVHLLVGEALCAPARRSSWERRLVADGSDELLWRASFAVPLELATDPELAFALVGRDGRLTPLPRPTPRSPAHRPLGQRPLALRAAPRRRRASAVVTSRRIAALASAAAVSGTTAPALAATSTDTSSSPASEAAGTATSIPTAQTTTAPTTDGDGSLSTATAASTTPAVNSSTAAGPTTSGSASTTAAGASTAPDVTTAPGVPSTLGADTAPDVTTAPGVPSTLGADTAVDVTTAPGVPSDPGATVADTTPTASDTTLVPGLPITPPPAATPAAPNPRGSSTTPASATAAMTPVRRTAATSHAAPRSAERPHGVVVTRHLDDEGHLGGQRTVHLLSTHPGAGTAAAPGGRERCVVAARPRIAVAGGERAPANRAIVPLRATRVGACAGLGTRRGSQTPQPTRWRTPVDAHLLHPRLTTRPAAAHAAHVSAAEHRRAADRSATARAVAAERRAGVEAGESRRRAALRAGTSRVAATAGEIRHAAAARRAGAEVRAGDPTTAPAIGPTSHTGTLPVAPARPGTLRVASAPPGGLPVSPTSPSSFAPLSWTGLSAGDPALTGAVRNLSGLLTDGDRPPSFLIPIYMAAARRYDVPWEILAAINAIESNYGRDLDTSSAGAVGWMQFEPATWARWGVSADGHSVANPYDPVDAIFTAARYLRAAGARQDLGQAVFAYNHAGWYVDEVMRRAHAITAHAQFEKATVNRRGTVSVAFATGVRSHPRIVYRSGLLSRYDRLIAAANMVSSANFPYLWGGGHEEPARWGPFDCSGSVSYVMQQAGYRLPTTVAGDIPSWGLPAGPGRVTIFYNPVHTFMRIGDRFFGTSGFARPGGGAGWFDVSRLPAAYLASFDEVHVPELGTDSFAATSEVASVPRVARRSDREVLDETPPWLMTTVRRLPT